MTEIEEERKSMMKELTTVQLKLHTINAIEDEDYEDSSLDSCLADVL